MATVTWSPQAIDDLGAVCDYIARDSPRHAESFADRVAMAVRRLETFPRSGRIVPEFEHPDLRELIVENYRVVYRMLDDQVEIVTVSHGARPLRGLSGNGDERQEV